MSRNQFRSLSIGEKVSLLPGIVNTVSNVYMRVIDGTPQSFIDIDGDTSTPIPEGLHGIVYEPNQVPIASTFREVGMYA